MPDPSDALVKQLESDAGPHASPDQVRAAEKRRAAAGVAVDETPEVEARSVAPRGRRAKSQDEA